MSPFALPKRFALTRTLLLLFLLGAGCGIRDPERVSRIAEQAETDPRKVNLLISALRSDDEPTWTEAYRVLVALGPAATGPLKKAIRKGHPAAQRALLVLGEMGEPSLFPFLAEAREVETYQEMATEALAVGEKVLGRRLGEERSVGLCEAYLAWFPNGESRQRANQVRHEVMAEDAWGALGGRPSDGDIQAFLERFSDTPTGGLARRTLAGRRLSDAGIELARGRLDDSLRLVRQAKTIDPDLDTDGMEASVHFAMGKRASSERRLDDAVKELEDAKALNPGPELLAALGQVYLDRARFSFERGHYVLAMEDLARADDTSQELRPMVTDTRMSHINQLFLMISPTGGEVPPGVVEALVLAGQFAQPTLEGVLWRQLANGDSNILKRVVDAAVSRPERQRDPGLVPWTTNVVGRALSEADGDLKVFFSNRTNLALLSQPGDFLEPQYRTLVRSSLVVLRRYVAVVSAARYHVTRLGPIRGPLPDGGILSEAEVQALFKAGETGFDADSLPPLLRAQLLVYQLDRLPQIESSVKSRPGALAVAVLDAGISPFKLSEWTLVWERVGSRDDRAGLVFRLRDGNNAQLVETRAGATLRLDLVVDPVQGRIPAGWISGGLNVLFGLARPVMASTPEIQRFEFRIVEQGSIGEPNERLALALSRASLRRMDWRIIEAERPFTPSHLALVAEQRVK